MAQENDIKFFVINMDKDKDRLLAFKEQMDKQNLSFERHPGQLIDSKIVTFNGKVYNVVAKGYVGVAMAHLSLWEKISLLKDDYCICNVFEDDELLKENYFSNIKEELQSLNEPIDFFNLNVIRPMGKEIAPGILKVADKEFGKKVPNIWLSNYIITPVGARKIIKLITKEVTNLNINFDRTFVKIIHKHCDDLNSFILKEQDKHSIHDEDDSSKKEMNNKHFLYKTVSIIRIFFGKK